MDKRNVIEFFDRLAPGWDDDQVIKDRIIERILDNAHIGANDEVLDVACGTGVLFPYYMKRDVASVTGVDISPEMRRCIRFLGPKFDRHSADPIDKDSSLSVGRLFVPA